MSDQHSSSTRTPEQAASRHEFAIYKPTRGKTGGVFRLSLAREKMALFAESAAQKDERAFDWQGKITMKWALSDIGEVLAVLERRQDEAKLFHQTEKQNTALHIRHQAKADQTNYFVQMSKQSAATKEVVRVGVPISQGEAAVLATLLRTAAVRLAGW